MFLFRKMFIFKLICTVIIILEFSTRGDGKGRRRGAGGSTAEKNPSLKKCNLRFEDWDRNKEPEIVAVSYLSSQRYRQYAKESGPTYGWVQLEQQRFRGPIRIRGKMKNLEPSAIHGVIITEKGFMDCNGKIPDEDTLEEEAASGRMSVHYNPFNSKHGKSTSCYRHVGDLDQIEANQTAGAWTSFRIFDGRIQLLGPTSVIGRNFVILYREDDDEDESAYRYACGPIGIAYKRNYRVSDYVIPGPEDGNAYAYGFGGTLLLIVFLAIYEYFQRKKLESKLPKFKSRYIEERHRRIVAWRNRRLE